MARLRLKRRAAAANQYALVVGLIAAVALVSVTAMGGGVATLMSRIGISLGNGSTSAPTSGTGSAAPAISSISSQTGTPGQPIGPINFSVTDSDTAASGINVTASISGDSILGVGDVWITSLGGGSWQVTLMPTSDATGTATVTLTASDGALTGNTGFSVSTVAASPSALYSWGSDGSGLLGNGTATGSRSSPTPIDMAGSIPDTWKQVTAGGNISDTGSNHACAIAPDDKAWCWGSDFNGQMGDGATTGGSISPRQASGTTSFISLSAGDDHTCGIATNGVGWCWGRNHRGQVSGTAGSDVISPAISPPASGNTRRLVAGLAMTCGISSGGAAFCYGSNGNGQLGIGTTGTSGSGTVSTAGPIPDSWSEIGAGQSHACGIGSDGSLWCWGSDGSGRLGNGSAATADSPVPVAVATDGGRPSSYRSLSLTYTATCALASAGTVWCWGSDTNGELGNGIAGQQVTDAPAQIATDGGRPSIYSSVTMGRYMACGITPSGQGLCWGYGGQGQLGNGATGTQQAPTAIDMSGLPGGSGWRQIAAAADGTFGILR